jgi:hypothetical protein
MERKFKGAIIILVFAAVLLSIYYILKSNPVYNAPDLTAVTAYFLFGTAIIGLALRLKPIQMVDPRKQQLGEQSSTNEEPEVVGNYHEPFCDACGSPTGKARFCPNCGTPTREKARVPMSPRKTTNFEDGDVTMVPVTIEGTAMVPQGQIQNLIITKVNMGKSTKVAGTTTEKPMRQKKIRPMPEPPMQPVDNTHIERDIYEDPKPMSES